MKYTRYYRPIIVHQNKHRNSTCAMDEKLCRAISVLKEVGTSNIKQIQIPRNILELLSEDKSSVCHTFHMQANPTD